MDTTNIPAENAELKAVEATPVVAVDKMAWVKKINLKYLIIAIIIVGLGAVAFYYKNLVIAATVDGHIISRFSVIKKLEKSGGQNALDTLINNQLLHNDAAARKISVTDADVNKQMAIIKAQVESQGGKFEDALKQANLTMADLQDQVSNELLLEKLLGDKAAVSDADVDKYIADNKVTIPAGQEATTRDQIRDQLIQDKVGQNAQPYLDGQKTKAKIKTYVSY